MLALCCAAVATQAGPVKARYTVTAPARAAAGTDVPAAWPHADFGRERPSREAAQVAGWVMASGDNQGAAFVIVDKANAKVYVFEADGKLRGAAPALLGLAKGDDTVPGIGDRPLSQIGPEERTTPAGRFVAEPGRNARGEDIVWIDYDAAVSMHRVLTSNPAERRLQRLATPSVKDNRVSYGCINLPVAFYDTVLSPTVERGETIVYVLPETRPAAAVFGFRDAGKGKPPQTLARPAVQLQQLEGA
jgi:hypothetical protein